MLCGTNARCYAVINIQTVLAVYCSSDGYVVRFKTHTIDQRRDRTFRRCCGTSATARQKAAAQSADCMTGTSPELTLSGLLVQLAEAAFEVGDDGGIVGFFPCLPEQGGCFLTPLIELLYEIHNGYAPDTDSACSGPT
jgi:hypothetical protein